MLRDCPIDHRCMKRISVDQVLAGIAAQLASSSGPSGRRPVSRADGAAAERLEQAR